MRKRYTYEILSALWLVSVLYIRTAAAQFSMEEMSSGPVFTTGDGASGIESADLDQDGNADVAVCFSNAGHVQIFRNMSTAVGAGSTQFAQPVTIPFGEGGAFHLMLRDLNKDAKPDIIIANFRAEALTVMLNTSVPGNIQFAPPVHSACPAPAYALAAADLNMDGYTEVIVSSENLLTIFQYTKSSTGNVAFESTETLTLSAPVHDVKVADMSGDGNADIIAGTADGVVLFSNRTPMRSAAFIFEQTLAMEFGRNIHALDIGDLNGDFMPDIITANFPAAEISILQNTSAGNMLSLATPVHITTNASYAVAVADLDADGAFDIVSTADGQTWNLAELFRNTSGQDGKIAYAPAQTVTPAGERLCIDDFDGDGKDDLTIVQAAENMFTVWFQDARSQESAVYDANAYCNEDGFTGIAWTVSAEKPGTRYIIERTTDGQVFETVATVEGTASQRDFMYEQTIARSEWLTVFYRIVTNHSNGQKEYSSLIPLSPCATVVSDFVCVFPNPVDQVMHFSFSVVTDADMHFEIVDLNMRSRLEKTEHITMGTRTYALNVSELTTGSYIFAVRFGNLAPYVCRFEKL